jgi:hypothetical protein
MNVSKSTLAKNEMMAAPGGSQQERLTAKRQEGPFRETILLKRLVNIWKANLTKFIKSSMTC